MFDKWALRITKPAVDRMADYAIGYKVTADQMTFAGLGLGLFASLLIALGAPQIAIVPLLLGRIADGVDGAIARGSNQQTDRGAFLDITLDFVFYASVPLAFAIANPLTNALAGAVLLAAFVTTGTSFLAYASLAAKRGETSSDYPTKGIYYLGGITEGAETILFFVLCCLWPAWFATLAYIYAALCAFTTFTRLKAGWERFGT
jgi:phosphatidylglycerophosphate synthase